MRQKETLEQIKEKIEYARTYFSDNYNRYNTFRNMVFNTTLDPAMINMLTETKRPCIEFNIMEPYVSKLLSDFITHQPSVKAHPAEDARNIDPRLLEFLEGHVRAILAASDEDNMQYDLFRDLLSGGFTAVRIYTEYVNPMSFDQKICIERVYDPTLVGFDPQAVKSHKGDGNFCFDLHPVEKQQFIEYYGKKVSKEVDYNMRFGGYNWNYLAWGPYQEGVLMCEWFEKVKVPKKIVRLSNGQILEEKEYKKFKSEWESNFTGIGVLPEVHNTRVTHLDKIIRKVLVDEIILEEMETDYEYLPLIFIDGNSTMLRSSEVIGSTYQRTRPIIYNCDGVQKLKNYTGCAVANEMENIDQNKYVAMLEAIPPQYKEAYTEYQKPSVLIYRGFDENDPTKALAAPQPLPRVSAPPELFNTFTDCDRMMQVILGTFDSAAADRDGEMSGVAIDKLITQGNSAAGPYFVNYLRGLARIFKVTASLIPKYYTGERTLSVQESSGKTKHVPVNGEEGISMKFKPEDIKIIVEPGVNFETQKTQSLIILKQLAAGIPTLGEFFGTTVKGMEAILDNLTVRNVDELKKEVIGFVQQKQQEKAQEQQMMQQQAQSALNPLMIKNKELDLKAQSQHAQHVIDAGKLNVQMEEADTKRMQALASMGISQDQMTLDREKHQAERADNHTEMVNDTILQLSQMQQPQQEQNGQVNNQEA